MNKPHIKTLFYKAIPGKNVDYEKAPPVEGSFQHFNVRLENGRVSFEMKTHFSTTEEAREITDDFVKRWEIITGLEQDPGDLQFSYDGADIIDLKPDEIEGNTGTLNVSLEGAILLSGAVSLQINRGKYPSFPTNIAISPDLEVMYSRYKTFRENRESLTSMAYFCLTVLEHRFSNGKKRKAAANFYRIDYEILDKIGQFTARKGTASDARKYPDSGNFIPLNSQERTWLDVAIKRLILRVGERNINPNEDVPIITMADLPTLS